MTSNDDKLLGRLFSEAAHAEIPDGGFSRRVMRSLPDDAMRRARLWRAFCVVAAVAMAAGLRVWREAAAWITDAAAALMASAHPRTLLLHMAACVAVAVAWVVSEALRSERTGW